MRLAGSRLVFDLDTRMTVTIDLLDLRGRRVARLEPRSLEAGVSSVALAHVANAHMAWIARVRMGGRQQVVSLVPMR